MDDQPQPPPQVFAKRYVSGPLKYLVDEEQRAKALEVAAAYRKTFADDKWKSVLGKLQDFVEEDHLRIARKGRPTPITAGRRPRLITEASSARDQAPSTPRDRWDVVPRGPLTPLSPTPMGNSFAGGGFWEQITPQTKTPVTPAPATATTAIPLPVFSPIVPTCEEARSAYTQVKFEVDNLARTICSNRVSTLSKFSGAKEQLPDSMIRPKDTLKAAQLTLEHSQVKLKRALDPNLPAKLVSIANEESTTLKEYTLTQFSELNDIESWLHVDETTLEFTTIIDTQRSFLQMSRNRRKSSLLKLGDSALQQAWATRILEDAERAVDTQADASSTCSDEDDGYDYCNFLRSIKREVSSGSELTSMLGESSVRSRAATLESLALSRESTWESKRLSASPKKSITDVLKERKGSVSNTPSPEKRLSANASAGARGLGLSRITTDIAAKDGDVESAQISPLEKAFRRQGAKRLDLDHWASELKKMEDRQKLRENRNSGTSLQHQAHPTLTTSMHSRERGSASSLGVQGRDEGLGHERHISAGSEAGETTAWTGESLGTTVHAKRVSRSSFKQRGYTYLTGPIPLPPSTPITPFPGAASVRPFSLLPEREPSVGERTLCSSAAPRYESETGAVEGQLRAKTSGSIENEDEGEWEVELKKMESAEKARQSGEVGNLDIGLGGKEH